MDNGTNKSGGFLKLTVYAAVFGLIGGISFQGVNYLSDKSTNDTGALVQDVDQPTDTDGDKESKNEIINTSNTTQTQTGDVSEVVEEVIPSIVAINVKATIQGNDIFGRNIEQEAEGSGSGIIIGENDDEVLIATNNHVVEGANTVEVKFVDESVVQATVKGKDSASDLAVVSVNKSDLKDETKNQIKVAAKGDSDSLKVGEQAIAIGNALGYGTSVTVGYISAVDREVSIEDSKMTLIQTDAAINPGNSGGALINSKGEVVGINSVKYASAEVEGMGFAIPITKAIPIIDDLMTREIVPEEEQAYLGIVGEDVTEEYSKRFGMPIGIYIGKVSEGSPAQKAGLTEGQIITEIDGKSVLTMTELQEKMTYSRSGDTAEITVKEMYNGEYTEKKVTVTYGSKASLKTPIQTP